MTGAGGADRSRPPLRVAIAGAGLAGSMMACYLSRAGHQAHVFERRDDPRLRVQEGGRSINLALSHRGLRALDGIGLAEQVLARGVPMRGRMMHAPDGGLALQPYGVRDDHVIHSVSRGDLNVLLLDAAEGSGAKIHFGTRVRDLDSVQGRLTFGRSSSPAPDLPGVGANPEAFDLILGADGAFSAVRAHMQRRSGFDYHQEYLPHGYKELSLPPTSSGDFALGPNALHIWPRGGFMMIALPNEDRSFTCTLFWPLHGAVSFENVRTSADIERVFGEHFPDVLPLFPDLGRQYEENPVGSLVTIRCSPWDLDGKVLLLGDAAHAVVPFYGQGMNASFEDCRLLAEALAHGDEVASTIQRFASDRKPDTDALAALALDNYVTMRDRVASRSFLILRALGRLASRVFPSHFLPLYTMVTFTSMPYAATVRRWDLQTRRVRWLALAGAILIVALSIPLLSD